MCLSYTRTTRGLDVGLNPVAALNQPLAAWPSEARSLWGLRGTSTLGLAPQVQIGIGGSQAVSGNGTTQINTRSGPILDAGAGTGSGVVTSVYTGAAQGTVDVPTAEAPMAPGTVDVPTGGATIAQGRWMYQRSRRRSHPAGPHRFLFPLSAPPATRSASNLPTVQPPAIFGTPSSAAVLTTPNAPNAIGAERRRGFGR